VGFLEASRIQTEWRIVWRMCEWIRESCTGHWLNIIARQRRNGYLVAVLHDGLIAIAGCTA
jgi:hypothetical protein